MLSCIIVEKLFSVFDSLSTCTVILLFVECSAGHFNNDGSCVLCPGNTIKSSPGDDADCNVDSACDGIITVPNLGHTACGKAVRNRVLALVILIKQT